MTEAPDRELDPEIDGPLLEQLRLDLLKAGPTSGITGPRAREADQLLIRVRAFVDRAAVKRRERLQQQRQQGNLL